MLTKRIIPCLDVKNGRVVKGVNFVNLRDAGDPVENALFYDKALADELVFLDITASHEKRGIMLRVVQGVANVIFMPFTVGGGIRTIGPVVGGTVKGPRLNGKIRPPGADWLLIRPDNCAELDVRIVIETDDGANILVFYAGMSALTQEQVDGFLAGEVPEGVDIYVAVRFETGHEDYQWLTRLQAVGRGSIEPDVDGIKVTYSWYALAA